MTTRTRRHGERAVPSFASFGAVAACATTASLALAAFGCSAPAPPPSERADAGASDGATSGRGDGQAADAGAATEAGAADAGPSALHILFIGDSYTYVNDLPAMLSQIAATAGVPPTITTDQVVQGGATLGVQWQNGIAQPKIMQGGWTHVVLQGQSVEPLTAAVYGTDFFTYAQQFGDLIVAAGAKPTLFVTWARAAGDPIYAPLPNGIFAYPVQMQDELDIAYAEVARQWPQSVLSCAGEAFQRAIVLYPEIALQQSDRSHPTVAGTYLAASTFYVALTGNPVPAQSYVPVGVSAADAAKLRDVALVGTQCADVVLQGAISTSFPQAPDGGSLLDFGTAGSPVTTELELENTGGLTVDVQDGMTLAPPFTWTQGGAYPGASGTGTCGPSLAPGVRCNISVTYTGAASATGTLTLGLTHAYVPAATCALKATATSRALLTVSDSAGPFACTDATCAPNQVTASLAAGNGTAPVTLFVTNLGALPVTALGPGTPLAPPFYWAAGAFPGGTGTVVLGNPAATFSYCAVPLGVGETCIVTVTFAPTVVGNSSGAVNLAYADSMGPISPNANRNLAGVATDQGPLPP